VFAAPCLQYGVPVSTTLSHEVVETFWTLTSNMWITPASGYSVPYEACDPVEGDSYEIDGVAVSDFVGPGWYGRYGPVRWLELRRWNPSISRRAATSYGAGRTAVKTRSSARDANRAYIAAKRHQLGRADRRITKEIP
jgi:hypothetical protein